MSQWDRQEDWGQNSVTLRLTMSVAVVAGILLSPSTQAGSRIVATLNPVSIGSEKKTARAGAGTSLNADALESATFYVCVHALANGAIPNGQTINVHRITSTWEESTVTWTSFAVAFSPEVEGSFTADTAGWHSVDVTAIVRSWLDGSHGNHGVLLDQMPVTHPRVRCASRESDKNKPYLEIRIKERISQLRFEPCADTYVCEPGDPDASDDPLFGRSTDLYTGRAGPDSPARQTLIRFDFSSADAQSLPEVTRSTRQSAPALPEDKVITNGIGMKLALIQPGSFMMGSSKGYKSEKPVHEVTLTKPFYLGVYEVTQDQYKQVMGTNPSKSKTSDLLPVEMVSWENAVEFCRKLSAMEGHEYRLPTEAEWEYACRAGTTTAYSTGAKIATDQANFDGKYTLVAGVKGVYRGKTTAVGSFEPNPWGLYDMHGNVWEWCADWFDSNYYKTSPEQDPTGPASGTFRLLRGGGFNSRSGHIRSAFRLGVHRPDYRGFISGFRVVREASGMKK